jgi:HAD superfamily hydrolase (TIGR01509 family)
MEKWNRKKIIKGYVDFFKKKNHNEIVNSSLVPENDPTVLFTTAGMHPLVPFLLGEKHPQGKRLVNVQKCIRTGDIEEVGDDVHLTFFEMLGNWSLGDYFKEDSIKYSYEFLTKILEIPKEKIIVTCFEGDENSPKDKESEKVWKSLGVKKIKFLGKKDNWWGPAGLTGPCGPDTEIFINNTEIWNNVFMQYNKEKSIILVDGMHCLYDKGFKINKELLEIIGSFDNKKVLVVNGYSEKAKEILNEYGIEIFSLEDEKIKKDNVKFFERLLQKYRLNSQQLIYFDHAEENIDSAKKLGIKSILYKDNNQIKGFIEKNNYIYTELKQKNVDTGMGVERILSVLNKKDIFETDCFLSIIQKIEELSKKKYKTHKKEMRIIADHIKASVFILADEVIPSNTERGYVLRRLIRKAIRYSKRLGISSILEIAKSVFDIYEDYEILKKNKPKILVEIGKEEEKFIKTLEDGEKLFENMCKGKKEISCKDAFLLYQSYGFPIEMIEELCKDKKIKVDICGFENELKQHQELSRTSSSGTFKSGLADNSEEVTKLHTTTHLLNQALRIVLKDKNIIQKGSNITAERLRFDFNFPRRLTEKEIRDIEDLVNAQIQNKCEVVRKEMDLKEAKKIAQGVFGGKYSDKVFVYSIGNFSKEICSGPHVKNLCELGKFRIIKEESVAAGIRRIKARLE